MALTRPSKLISSDISGSFNKSAVSASFAQSSAVTASLRSHVLTSALSGSTTIISGSVKSTGSFGSIYTDKNVNASAFVGDGSSLTGIDIPTAAAISGSFISKADKSAISGSIVGGVSGSALSTGSFGRVEVASTGSFGRVEVTGDLSVTGAGQGWVKLSSQTLSADTSPVVMGSSSIFSTTYDQYMITAHYVTPRDDGDLWYIRFKVDDSIQTSNYRYVGNETMGASASPPEYHVSNGTSWIRFFGYGGTTAGESLDFQIFLANPDSSPATFPKIWWHGVGVDRDGTCRTCRGIATNTGTTGNLDEILLYSNPSDSPAGATSSGTFTVYGLTI